MSKAAVHAGVPDENPVESGLASSSETRAQRKRRETRERIVVEAERLMRSRPIDEVTIQDITDAADVGHGTFYLHFKSKYEVLVPIVRAGAARTDSQIQESLGDRSDPAEVVAFSARHMARAIAGDPMWRWFVEHSGVPVEDMRETLGRFSARDFGKGLMSGRFSVPELAIGSSFMFGGFVSGLLASLAADNEEVAIDQMVEMILRSLGISLDEARDLAHRPLDPLVPSP